MCLCFFALRLNWPGSGTSVLGDSFRVGKFSAAVPTIEVGPSTLDARLRNAMSVCPAVTAPLYTSPDPRSEHHSFDPPSLHVDL